MNYSATLMKLLERSYSAFHAVNNMETLLIAKGFTKLDEKKPWNLKADGKYFVERNQSSIIAFRLPHVKSFVFQLTASHTDSPTFKLKPNPLLIRGNSLMLDVEPYGGGIYNTWMDKPLSIAGRVLVEVNGKADSYLFADDEDLSVIPNLAIHMNREINTNANYNPAIDMLPLLGKADMKFDFNKWLLNKLALTKGQVLAHDLFLYNRQKPTVCGINGEYLLSPRLDDLASSYSCLLGFLEAKKNLNMDIYASFDNEEVGSLTKQGANSTFLKDTLRRLVASLGGGEEDYYMAVNRGCLLSVDNAHANHPNHPEISDPTTSVTLNGGIVIKYNANQSYTSDAFSSAIVKALCRKNSLRYQEFTNRSDLRGGSTLGNISNAEVSFTSVDIGLPQLAMHSASELMGIDDIKDMVTLIKTFYSSDYQAVDNGFSI